MAQNYAGAVRAGTIAAARLHDELGIRSKIEGSGGGVDIFGAISNLGLPLMLRPLKGLLGAYINYPTPGVLVTTERPMSIQRFTAAHELGHYYLEHNPSLDDESILRRMPNSPEPGGGFQETEADSFAVAFLLPKWLIISHAKRQGWMTRDFAHPHTTYQLSLRLGASYEATCRTLQRYELISLATMKGLLEVKPRQLKVELLGSFVPPNYRGDVWELGACDEGTRIEGSRNDVFILRLTENSGGGYLWDFDELSESGFAIVADNREAFDLEGVGGPTLRRVTAAVSDAERGQLILHQRRPWQPTAPISRLSFDYDVTGPEQAGLSRAERKLRLAEV